MDGNNQDDLVYVICSRPYRSPIVYVLYHSAEQLNSCPEQLLNCVCVCVNMCRGWRLSSDVIPRATLATLFGKKILSLAWNSVCQFSSIGCPVTRLSLFPSWWFVCFVILIILLLYTWALGLSVCLCTMCMHCLQRPEEGFRSRGTEITEACDSPCGW